MSERSTYEPGTPCWVDVTVPDVAAATEFYSGVFGWTSEDMQHEGQHIYTNFRKDGKLVAGLSPQMPGMEGMPPFWSSYVSVEDAEQVAKAVEAAGGTVMMAPMQVMDEGSMAVFADPTGAAFSVWQPANHIGSEVVNEADTYAWNELRSRDVAAASTFYADVFGWSYDTMDMGPMGDYLVVQGGDEGGLAGLMPMPDVMPAEVPAHWAVYFMVDDAQATIDRVTAAGGTVVHGPDPSPVGILGGLIDPQGAAFSIMQPAQHDE